MRYGMILWLCAFAWPAIAETGTLPFFDKQELTPYWPNARTDFTPAQVSAFRALDQDGRAIDASTLDSGISLVNFFFAECPGVCPIMMQSVKKLQQALGSMRSQVKIYSFSVQPDKDSPDKLRAYARAFRIEADDWKLLTGDKREIYHVGKDMFKADGSIGAQKSEDSFIHTQNIYLLDKKRRIRGIYDTGNGPAMQLLAKDIAQLKEEL